MLRPIQCGSLVLLALASGCGSSVDHDSAVKVMNLALSGTVAGDGHVVSVDVDAAKGHVDVALSDSTGKGSAEVTGSIANSNGVITTEVDVEFKDWTDPLNQVTLNGSLHENGTFASPLPILGDVKLSGDLAVSGAVNATVDFDLKGNYSLTGLSVKGEVGGQSMNSGIDISIH